MFVCVGAGVKTKGVFLEAGHWNQLHRNSYGV